MICAIFIIFGVDSILGNFKAEIQNLHDSERCHQDKIEKVI